MKVSVHVDDLPPVYLQPGDEVKLNSGKGTLVWLTGDLEKAFDCICSDRRNSVESAIVFTQKRMEEQFGTDTPNIIEGKESNEGIV